MTMSRWNGMSLTLLLVVGLNASARESHTDQFDRAPLNPSWVFRNPGGGSYEIRDGWMHLTADGPLWVLASAQTSWPPMLLIEAPPADVITFETRLRFHKKAPLASAGLVAISKDGDTLMAFYLHPGAPMDRVSVAWRDGAPIESGGSAQIVQSGDTWLRVELPADMPFTEPKFFYKKGAAEEPWIAAENGARVPIGLPDRMDPRFTSGEFWIGLYVDGGLDDPAEDNELEVAFDYFRSPQLEPLAVEPGASVATTWGSLRQR